MRKEGGKLEGGGEAVGRTKAGEGAWKGGS